MGRVAKELFLTFLNIQAADLRALAWASLFGVGLRAGSTLSPPKRPCLFCPMSLYKFPPFDFDTSTGRLSKYGHRIKLQRKPQMVLAALLEEPGKTVSRQDLYERLWPQGVFVDFDQGLSVAVKKLRDALCDSSDDPKYITTSAGLGYRFVGTAVRVHVPAGEAAPDYLPKDAAASQPAVSDRGDAGDSSAAALRPSAARDHGPRIGVIAALIVVALGALALLVARPIGRSLNAGTRSLIAPPPDWQLLTTQDTGGSVALSPDGSMAVYGARHSKLGAMLLLRKLDSLSAEPIPGTSGGAMPFWSPDGRRVGFFTDQQLKTVDIWNGSVHVVHGFAESARGGTWGPDDTILFAESTRGPILRISATGGQPVKASSLTPQYTTHRWPQFLPDGRHFIFFAANHNPTAPVRPAVFIGSVDGGPARFVVESDSNAQFVAGRLLFVSGGKLFSRFMDPDSGELGSAASILTENIEYDQRLWHATFAASPQLLLFRERAAVPDAQVIAFVDSSGKAVRTASRPSIFRGVSVSPDGKTLAAMCDDPDMEICLVHPDGTLTRISDTSISYDPVWSPGGKYIVYGTHRGAQRFGLVLKDANSQEGEIRLVESFSAVAPTSWVPRERAVLFERTSAKGKRELAIFRLEDHQITSLLGGDFNVRAGRFSPDGRWIAYQSDERGRDEIYITSYPDSRTKRRVSQNGGHAPRWATGGGRELYFLDSSDAIHRLQLDLSEKQPTVKSDDTLFQPSVLPPPNDSDSFDVVPGQGLFALVTPASSNTAPYILATSWHQ